MRYIMIAVGCAFILASTAWAQRPRGQEQRRGPSLEQRAAARVSILDEQVGGLTEEQKTKASEIYTQQLKEMESVRRDTSITPTQRREKLQKANEQAEQAIDAILTTEQKEKRVQEKAKIDGALGTGKESDVAPATQP